MLVLDDQEKNLLYADMFGWNLLYAGMFGCQVGSWPIKYLGVPVCGSRIHVKDEKPLSDELKKIYMVGLVTPLRLVGDGLSSSPL
jgi:hypothetical protein